LSPLLALAGLPAKEEMRYCTDPAHVARQVDGSIRRDMVVVAKFKRLYPCPSNGTTYGECPYWAIDHVIPLVCGGCDAVSNMQWLPVSIKSAAGSAPKDRWERRVYCGVR